MSDHQDSQEIAHLEQVNKQLTTSLARCRLLLADCRTKLAANSNDKDVGDPDAEAEPHSA
jgi:hypothetical protein